MFDIVNNKMCPWCKAPMHQVKESVAGANSFTYYQCSDHLEVGYGSTNSLWIVIRISPFGFDQLSLYIWSWLQNDNDFGIIDSAESNVMVVCLPPFPVFNYSLTQLADKIKIYTIFS